MKTNNKDKLLTKLNDLMDRYEKNAMECGYAQGYSQYKNFVHDLDDIKKQIKQLKDID